MEIPEELDTPEFRDAWEAYCQLRKAKRWGQWIPQTVAIRFSQFVDWGVEKATIALRKSVENEWRGVFEPKPSEMPQSINRNEYRSFMEDD